MTRRAVAMFAALTVMGLCAPAAEAVAPVQISIGSRPVDLTFSESNGGSDDMGIENHLVQLIRSERVAIVTNIFEVESDDAVVQALRDKVAARVPVYVTYDKSDHLLDFTDDDKLDLC